MAASWWRKWFRQAGEIERLRLDLEFATRAKHEIEALLLREEQRNAVLDKALQSERKAHNGALRRYADQVSKQAGLPQHFVQDAKEPAEQQPTQYSPDEEADIRWMAQEQRNADIDAGMDVAPLEDYIKVVRDKGVREFVI